MTSATNLGSLVPGFDFLQGLMKSGSSAMPGIGQWIAPTLDPAELQKRIDELRTVQFWLEQNSKLLGTTIQALEVQRMTLATLKGMNVPVADLAGAFTLGRSGDTPARASSAKPASTAAASADTPAAPPTKGGGSKSRSGSGAGTGGGAAAAGVDAMQWWGALTQQFTELAAKAWRDSSAGVARNLKGSGAEAAAAGALDSIERAMGRAGKSASAAASAAPSAPPAPPASSAAPAPAKRRRKS